MIRLSLKRDSRPDGTSVLLDLNLDALDLSLPEHRLAMCEAIHKAIRIDCGNLPSTTEIGRGLPKGALIFRTRGIA